MTKDKFLFLDIDGVLNTPAAECGYAYVLGVDRNDFPEGNVRNKLASMWCPGSLYNLYRIIEATRCKIVISSTWRLGSDLKEMRSWFSCELLKNAVIDKTPSLGVKWKDGSHNVPRGLEIELWVNDWKRNNGHKPCKIAIIDDDSDMWPLDIHFFKCHGYDGLDWNTADKVIEHLGREG